MYGLEKSLDNSLMVVCGGEVVVAAVHNATAAGDVVAAFGVVVADDVVVGKLVCFQPQCWL